jgi:hypothetical protein
LSLPKERSVLIISFISLSNALRLWSIL